MSDWKLLYPLHAASQSGDIVLLKQLISEIPSSDIISSINLLDDDNWSCLHYSSFYNNIETVEYLILNGIDVNIMDKLNRKSLHITSGCGNIEIVKILIQHMNKDEINSKNIEKQTALQVCNEIKPDNWKEIIALLESYK